MYTGAPEGGGAIASCDADGRWQTGGTTFEHWVYEIETKRRVTPTDVGRSLSLFRGSLPFPAFSWQPSDLQINQLVYPVGKGFAAMYHVMNHGENPKACRLFVGVAGDAAKAQGRGLRVGDVDVLSASEAASASKEGDGGRPALGFDLTIDPGSSKFVFVTTPDLQGRVPDDALDLVSAAWDKKLGEGRLLVPDKAMMLAYYADLAGAVLGIAGCAERAKAVEARLVKKEGDVLRLLPEIPESWQVGRIEMNHLATEFGPLSFVYEGAFNLPSYDFTSSTGRPPGGFLVAIPAQLKAKIDGKPAEGKDGWLKVPAAAKRVETVRGD